MKIYKGARFTRVLERSCPETSLQYNGQLVVVLDYNGESVDFKRYHKDGTVNYNCSLPVALFIKRFKPANIELENK